MHMGHGGRLAGVSASIEAEKAMLIEYVRSNEFDRSQRCYHPRSLVYLRRKVQAGLRKCLQPILGADALGSEVRRSKFRHHHQTWILGDDSSHARQHSQLSSFCVDFHHVDP